MLNGDFLLSTASVVVEPFGQHPDRPCHLVGGAGDISSSPAAVSFFEPFSLLHPTTLNRGTGPHGERSER
jgi:hypothetical protein